MQKQIEILSAENKIIKTESLLYATNQKIKLREIDVLNEIKKADTELKENIELRRISIE